MADAESVVYFVQAGDFIKIGTTTNLDKRIRALRTGSPFSVTLLRAVYGASAREHKIQKQFNHIHVQGEWYTDAPELREFIRTLDWHDDTQDEICVKAAPIENRLKALLAERNMNLSDLAELADTHYTTMRRFAGDEAESIHKGTLDKVCAALGVQPGDIFTYRPDIQAEES